MGREKQSGNLTSRARAAEPAASIRRAGRGRDQSRTTSLNYLTEHANSLDGVMQPPPTGRRMRIGPEPVRVHRIRSAPRATAQCHRRLPYLRLQKRKSESLSVPHTQHYYKECLYTNWYRRLATGTLMQQRSTTDACPADIALPRNVFVVIPVHCVVS